MVGSSERARDGGHQIDGVGELERPAERDLLERLTVEPLERHERDERLRVEDPELQWPHDLRECGRETEQELRLAPELLEERLALVLGERVGDLQAFERDRRAKDLVVRAVDHAEPALGHGLLDAKEARLRRPRDPERVTDGCRCACRQRLLASARSPMARLKG